MDEGKTTTEFRRLKEMAYKGELVVLGGRERTSDSDDDEEDARV